jgi:hypothetical protein
VVSTIVMAIFLKRVPLKRVPPWLGSERAKCERVECGGGIYRTNETTLDDAGAFADSLCMGNDIQPSHIVCDW